jgi:hypothetical protein
MLRQETILQSGEFSLEKHFNTQWDKYTYRIFDSSGPIQWIWDPESITPLDLAMLPVDFAVLVRNYFRLIK